MFNKITKIVLSLVLLVIFISAPFTQASTANEWGPWSDWQDGFVERSSILDVETRTTVVGYHMIIYVTRENVSKIRNYRSFSVNGNYSGYGLDSGYGEFRYTHYYSKSKLDSSRRHYDGDFINVYSNTSGYQRDSATSYWDAEGSGYAWFIEREDTKTQYRYRSLIVAPPIPTYTVTFRDWDGTTLLVQTVREGQAASPPREPSRVGYTFIGWDISYLNVRSNLTVTAQYTENVASSYTVTFRDWDGTILKTQTVRENQSATPPPNPVRNGFTFTGWDLPYSNIRSNLIVTALYTENAKNSFMVTFRDWNGATLKTQLVEAGKSATPPADPTRDGYIFTGWDKSYANVQSALTVTAQYKLSTPLKGLFMPRVDGYRFVNSRSDLGLAASYRTPIELWIEVYGQSTGRAFFEQYGQSLWGGSCFGFSVTSTKFYNGNLDVRNYGASITYDIPAPRSSTHPVTQLIEKSQISWYLPGVSYVNFNRDSLIAASENFALNGNDPIIMYIDARAGIYSYVHAVVPWKTERVGGNTRIYVYDSNQPGNENVYFTISSNGALSCNYQYAGNNISISQLGFISLRQVLNGESLAPRNLVHISVDIPDARILTADGRSVENLDDAQRVEQMPVENYDYKYAEYLAYWLPKGGYKIIAYDDEPVTVVVSDSGDAYTVHLLPTSTSVVVEIGDELGITGAVHGNITEYSRDGTEMVYPVMPASTVLSAPGSGTRRVRFDDVSHGVWFADAVTSISTVGLVEGVGGNRFNPNAELTVAELVAMLVRTQYGKLPSGSPWYAHYISQGERDGIIYASDHLDPEANVTRAQAALIITRYVEKFNPRWAKSRVDNRPADIASIPGKYRPTVEKAFTWGLVHGDNRGYYNPDNTLTRAEAAQMLMNYYRIVD